VTALTKSLGPSGVFATQSPNSTVAESLAYKLNDASLSFDSIFRFEEKVHGYVWNFVVATREGSGREAWFTNEAEANLAMRQRQTGPLVFFDGATQQSYQYPSRLVENSFCSHFDDDLDSDDEDETEWCKHGFNPDAPNYHEDSFYVDTSRASRGAGRGVFSKEFIPAGAFVCLECCVNSIYVPSPSLDLQQKAYKTFRETALYHWKAVWQYYDGYGWFSDDYVSTFVFVYHQIQHLFST